MTSVTQPSPTFTERWETEITFSIGVFALYGILFAGVFFETLRPPTTFGFGLIWTALSLMAGGLAFLGLLVRGWGFLLGVLLMGTLAMFSFNATGSWSVAMPYVLLLSFVTLPVILAHPVLMIWMWLRARRSNSDTGLWFGTT